MEIEILSERENPLLNRREIKFRANYEGATPKIEEVRKKLIIALNSNEKLTVLDGIKSEFGRNSALGYVKVYTDEKGMKVEPLHRIKKNFEPKEKKKPEEKPEEKPPEKPEGKLKEKQPE